MIQEYVAAALARAKYEKIRDRRNPYFAKVPGLRGIWATGKTLEECRKNLLDVIDGWIAVRLRQGLRIPPLGKYRVEVPRELKFGT